MRPCVSRTAALAGRTVLGSDLGNCVVSRVPTTLARCPCHSPETPSGPCSPVSVPVQAPPPWERWLHACIPSGSEDPYWAASGPLGPWDPPSHLHSAPGPPPQSWMHPQGWPLPQVLQGPPLSASALKRIRFARGWLLWSLKSWHFNISFLGSSMTLHLGIMLGWDTLTQCKSDM